MLKPFSGGAGNLQILREGAEPESAGFKEPLTRVQWGCWVCAPSRATNSHQSRGQEQSQGKACSAMVTHGAAPRGHPSAQYKAYNHFILI